MSDYVEPRDRPPKELRFDERKFRRGADGTLERIDLGVQHDSDGKVVALLGRRNVKGRSKPEHADGRADVLLDLGRIDKAADDSSRVLAATGYYSRGEVLVRYSLGAASSVDDVVRRYAGPTLIPASLAGLTDDLERTVIFWEAGVDGLKARKRSCPKNLPAVILSRVGRWHEFPLVRGISFVPVVHADGTVVYGGYDARARVVVAVPDDWPRIDPNPDYKTAKAALAPIRELLAGFPFRSEVDFSVTLAAMLTAVIGCTLKARPAFGFDASTAGTGKSKLADIVAIVGSGRPAAAVTWADREEESEKRLGSALLAGDPFILLDNVERDLRSQMLNSAITQEGVAIRLLGRSHMPRVESCAMFIATGNNLVIAGDLTRRFLVAGLDAGVERPELRRFDFDPVDRATRNRVDLVNALLTIALYGRTIEAHLTPLGSFEDWSYRVRDTLVNLGCADPLKVMERLHQHDPARETAAYLVTQWRRAFGGTPTSTDHAIRVGDATDAQLRDALDTACGQAGGINKRRLGKYLRHIAGRVFGGLRVCSQHDPIGNRQLWYVETLALPAARAAVPADACDAS